MVAPLQQLSLCLHCCLTTNHGRAAYTMIQGEKIPEKIMQQKPAWKAPPCARLCLHTHINCGAQLLYLISCARSTVAHLHYEYNYLPIIIHKVPTITISRFDNAILKNTHPE